MTVLQQDRGLLHGEARLADGRISACRLPALVHGHDHDPAVLGTQLDAAPPGSPARNRLSKSRDHLGAGEDRKRWAHTEFVDFGAVGFPQREQLSGGRRAGDLARSPAREGASGGLPPITAQARSTTTPSAWEARATRSATSPVSTTPAGSAVATTTASTADPRRAWLRSRAPRLTKETGSDCWMSHVLRNRLVMASRPESPVRHSTRTTDGTSGGQRPSSRRATINAAARLPRAARRLTPPESRTSTSSARGSGHPLRKSSCDCLRSRGFARGRLPDFGYQFLDVAVRFREQVLATDLGCESFLQQFRGREASRLQLLVEIVREVHLHPRHTPNYTHLKALANCSRRSRSAQLVSHNANNSPVVEGPVISLAPRHANVRRAGYRVRQAP